MQEYVKPPFGITPKRIMDSKRIEEIRDAIKRRIETNMLYEIPIDWIQEYNMLVENYK